MRYHNLDLQAFEYRNEGGTETFKVLASSPLATDARYADAETVGVPDDLRSYLGLLVCLVRVQAVCHRTTRHPLPCAVLVLPG